ncbi:hypothetical protein FHETE_231 [Fusarium heterosporum]|uniref:Uncharacterized protein n=1 Tax=Fusarium heterosporum TaxID=42747 RepID=A0A8H5U1J4_FUSHE|nr:hypothetical protein FHETE_231 [Fusarium heterosporum]
MASNDLVHLKPKQKRRLYESVVMYKALTDFTREKGALRSAEATPRPLNEQERYHLFLHKLASVCDSIKGGRTVTSVTILDEEDKFVYVFGCNQVFGRDLDGTQDFMATLLKKLSGAHKLGQEEKCAVEKDVLKMILSFNSPRISCYLNELKKKNIAPCLAYCGRQSGTTDASIANALRTLDSAIEDITFKGWNQEQCKSGKLATYSLRAFLTTTTTQYINNRAEQDRLNEGRNYVCWAGLRHSLSRLLNYKRTVQCLISAEKEWPELFQEFVVVPVESSTKDLNPLGKKSESAHAIIGRMCGDRASQDRYRMLAQNLQGINLDDRIKDKSQSAFRPIVHAEILVLEWVMAKSRSNLKSRQPAVSFFHDWKYIGSSKGACQLCRYYFDTVGQHDGIETRASHGNLYINWRFPDVYESDSSSVKTRRQNIFNFVIEKIRAEVLEILVHKNSKGKQHDSSTHPLMSVRNTDVQTDLGARSVLDSDELAQNFAGGLILDSSGNSFEESDFDDDDNGGTSLG